VTNLQHVNLQISDNRPKSLSKISAQLFRQLTQVPAQNLKPMSYRSPTCQVPKPETYEWPIFGKSTSRFPATDPNPCPKPETYEWPISNMSSSQSRNLWVTDLQHVKFQISGNWPRSLPKTWNLWVTDLQHVKFPIPKPMSHQSPTCRD